MSKIRGPVIDVIPVGIDIEKEIMGCRYRKWEDLSFGDKVDYFDDVFQKVALELHKEWLDLHKNEPLAYQLREKKK